MTSAPLTPLKRIARLTAGLLAAMATPMLFLPITPFIVVPLLGGIPNFAALYAAGAVLSPIPGIALHFLSEPVRRKVLVLLALVFLGILIAGMFTQLSNLLLTMRSLLLACVMSSLTFSLLRPVTDAAPSSDASAP